MTTIWLPDRPEIIDSYYDDDNHRAVIIVKPCHLADYFSLVRFIDDQALVIEDEIKATGDKQEFYDYSLDSRAEYTVLSYSKCEGALFPAHEAAIPVVICANKHWNRRAA